MTSYFVASSFGCVVILGTDGSIFILDPIQALQLVQDLTDLADAFFMIADITGDEISLLVSFVYEQLAEAVLFVLEDIVIYG